MVSTSALIAQSDVANSIINFEPTDTARDRVVPIKVYLPASRKPSPVILFSHGLGGSRENNAYLGKHWAKNGYVAVFMQHVGSDESLWRGVPAKDIQTALKKGISLQATTARFKDVPFVLDQLTLWNQAANHQLQNRLNLDRIGMAGHSYGAVTTQAMMGQVFPQNRSAKEPRIDAFIPMSPSISKMLSPQESFGNIEKPVLCMTGTKDFVRIAPTATPESRMKVYQHLPAPDKYQLIFKDGEHFAFGQAGFRKPKVPHHHPAILTLSTLFWDAYLKNDASAKETLQSNEARELADLIEEDIWEWK